jgi:hypothetical protein
LKFVLQFAPGLPKTRSGKIMRRILRKIAADKPDELGDVSTLFDPSIVEAIVHTEKKTLNINVSGFCFEMHFPYFHLLKKCVRLFLLESRNNS